jgi:hypothetical protein
MCVDLGLTLNPFGDWACLICFEQTGTPKIHHLGLFKHILYGDMIYGDMIYEVE